MGHGTIRGDREERERGLSLRKIAEYVDVGSVLSPLVRYMRWYASRTPDEIYSLTLDPTEIDRMKLFPPQRVPVTGPEALCGGVGGPWDRLTMSVENHYLHQSIQPRLESGVPWEETQLYRHPKYAGKPKKARRRGEKIERLIDSIEEHGYRRQLDPDAGTPERNENAPPNEWIGDLYVGDEVIVGLDRNGEPIHLRNGRHRLTVARLLGVEEIPVVLSIFHPGAESEIPADAELIHSG